MTSMDVLFRQRRVTVWVATLSLVGLMSPGINQAQTTNITESGLNTRVTTSGATTFIDGGTRPGTTSQPNLFHSFGDFSIGTGDTALFRAIDVVGGVNTAYSGSSIQNIIGRVTGNNPSSLYGTLDTISNFPTANLFLVNPNGIVFGANATINVGGSANFVAGDYLRMADNALFFANLAQTSTLSVAPVNSFGFLAGNPVGTISIQGGTVRNTSALTIVGRDNVVGTSVTPGIDVTGTLSNIGGQVTLVSVGGPTNAGAGEVTVADQTPTGFHSLGTIAMKPGAAIDTSTNTSVLNPMAAGALTIRGERLAMDGASLRAISRGYNINPDVGPLDPFVDVTAGDITITVNALAMANGTIQTGSAPLPGSFGSGEERGGMFRVDPTSGFGETVHLTPGNISVKVQDVFAQGSNISTSSTLGEGARAGQITVEGVGGTGSPATSVSLDNSTMSTEVSGDSSTSPPATITITAQTLALANQAIIRANTFGAGPAGDITLNVGTLRGSPISAITSNSWLQDATAGHAGTITIQGIAGSGTPAATVSLDNSLIETGIFGGSAAATPGAITITAQTLALTNAGTVGADTQGMAPAGDITLNVDTLTVGDAGIGSSSWLQNTTAGKAGTITIQGVTGSGSLATHVRVEGGVSSISAINTQILGGSAATIPGAITITAQELVLGKMFLGADTLGAASAGDITFNVDTLTLDDAGIDSTSSLNNVTAGKAGTITIQGVDGAGSLADTVSLDNSYITTTIFGGSAATTPGAITITAQALALQDNGVGIRADTNGAAPAGGITLNVDTLTAANSTISSSNAPFDFPPDLATGNAGNITIQGVTGSGSSANTVHLDNSSMIGTTIRGGSSSTTPATINITAQTVNLESFAQISANTSGLAPAGDITLNVGTLTARNSSRISSSSFPIDDAAAGGNAGSITIQGITGSASPATNVSLDDSVITTSISDGSAANTPATITITAHTLALANAGTIVAGTNGAAPAGNIAFHVGTLTAGNFSVISTSSFPLVDPAAAGNAGTITIQGITGSGSPAANVSLDGMSGIQTSLFGGSAANTAANIDITAHTLALANFSEIHANADGEGPAGNIVFHVGTLTAGTFSTISSAGVGITELSGGNAGSIAIQGITGFGSPAANVSLDNSTINTSRFQGNAANTAANIDITAQTLTLANFSDIRADSSFGSAPAGNIIFHVGTLTAGTFSTISSSASGNLFFHNIPAGNAGSIAIQGITGSGSPAANVSLDNSTISTTISDGIAANIAANIDITTQTLALANFSAIRADTSGAAPAGNIALNVDTLAVGNSIISSSSLPSFVLEDMVEGNAGNITIQGIDGSGSPAANVSLDRGVISTQIFGGTAATQPGIITITAQTLDLAISNLSADTAGAAPAGNITLNVDKLTADLAQITSGGSFNTAVDAGNAGRITIQGTSPGSPATSVSLNGVSSISTEIFGGTEATPPGSITITAQTLDLAALIHADTSGPAPAGDITLNVDTLTAGGSRITSNSTINPNPTVDEGNAGNITIQGTSPSRPAASVDLDGGSISTTIKGGTSTSAPATITIIARTLDLAAAQIQADTFGPAPAGDITLNVDTLTAGQSTVIGSGSFDFDFFSTETGNAGSITIQGVNGPGSPAANVNLDLTGISTQISGQHVATTPGAIAITAQTLTLANSNITADAFGPSPAGNITVNVDTLTATNSINPSGNPASISSSSGQRLSTAGNAGSITIQGIASPGSPATPATRVSLEGDTFFGPNQPETCCAFISTEISGGNADTPPGAITIIAKTLDLADFAHIRADTTGAAPAGDITLNVGTLTVIQSTIDSQSSDDLFFPLGPEAGNAGSITIQGTSPGSPAANVSLDESAIRTTIVSGTSSSMPANITMEAHAVTLSNGGAITASTTGNAPAGNIKLLTQRLNLSAESSITSDAVATLIPSPIFSGEPGVVTSGKAGSITITGAGSAPTMIAGGSVRAQSSTTESAGNITLKAPGDLTLLGTTVSVKNTGTGNAGRIDFIAGNDLLVRNSQVSTESAQASGGNIKLTAPNLIRIVDSTLTSSVQGQAGSNGGNINIDPILVVIQNSQLLANANAGAGGNINIVASGAVLVDPNSRLSATAGPAGISGTVNINAPIQILSGTLVPLNLVYSQAGLSGDRCAADPQGQFSSFVQTGRDAVPQVPGALSPSPLSFLETLTSGSLGSPGPNWAAARLGLDFVNVDDSTLFRFHSACRS